MPRWKSDLIPVSLRSYQRRWLRADVLAGVTLAAVAIPETMGYTSIAQMPIVTGLYTIIFPTVLFALLGSSKLLVVGADSATAAILAAGLAGVSISGLTPDSPKWVAFAGLTALVCGGLLAIARLLRLGFLGDFLSASVLIGFLTGVGIQVLSGQIPDMLGISGGTGNWFKKQWHWITSLSQISWTTFAFAAGAILIILGFGRFAPKIPGAIVAVVLSIVLSATLDASAHGVAIVGAVKGGFPPVGLPSGITWSDVPKVIAVAFSCAVLIIAQSAATSRSFAMKHGDPVDINRDLIGLSGSNIAAGLTGTFVVNGSPTKTQILDGQRGRTQLANLTMSVVTLLVVLFFTGVLKDMPEAVLGAIVFLVGVDLIDVSGLRRIYRRRVVEFAIAAVTGFVVFAIGVEQGIILAIVLSILEIVRRQYNPTYFVVGVNKEGEPTYQPAIAGAQSEPGLIVFRYDADLFYANVNRFVDDVERLISTAPDPVRCLILDAAALSDVDYSAGISLANLLEYLGVHHIEFKIARVDSELHRTLVSYDLMELIGEQNVYGNLVDAVAAFRSEARPV
ncbi:high affinity sulphate transporter 1 [Jatrophihabitans sp. GAS493]|uniref:SulP family inorganic anion transporter n=1 Tax=Jatrophihabitans sp. GAS493 TaxID=1907575 RepID=UPI000BB96D5F|nr:SulP family inorganic anion transporter [Jatrophihabitans sp. GAS493]SOD71960.1 high affinity sulphate transporter 1 [Jatrophihabitans sp. GAS493]